MPKSNDTPRIAIVCDWLVGIGGAERVVLEVHRMFPDAPIYTSQYDPGKIDWFNDADVRTGWLQKLPVGLKKFLPVLRAWYFSHLDLSEYDLVITCNFGAEAKAVRAKPGAHICLCNAPTHYYWSRYEAYLRDPGFPKGFNLLARLGLKLLVTPLRRWDYKAAQNPDHLVAISTHIQQEIKRYYNRDSTIIHPPVDTERFKEKGERRKEKGRQGFVIAGRQTPYKKVDLAVAACTKLNLPLTVIGDGPDHESLRKIAGPTITFTGQLSDEEVARRFAAAEAFIFPGLDDFGITPVEAMAAGTPVIAYRAGGALDYVVPGTTGEFFDQQTVDSLARALSDFKPSKYSAGDIKRHAGSFSAQNFQKNLSDYIARVLQ
ncbi:MAG TPA: glycosyltransferase [Candidatus Limnocylindria bacterium]|nr:glycosyltransferase [Candidatus Limnocylindria bacterium]